MLIKRLFLLFLLGGTSLCYCQVPGDGENNVPNDPAQQQLYQILQGIDPAVGQQFFVALARLEQAVQNDLLQRFLQLGEPAQQQFFQSLAQLEPADRQQFTQALSNLDQAGRQQFFQIIQQLDPANQQQFIQALQQLAQPAANPAPQPDVRPAGIQQAVNQAQQQGGVPPGMVPQAGNLALLQGIIPGQQAGQLAFPISDNQYPDGITKSQWLVACAKGQTDIIQHFLDTNAYEPFLNLPDQGNRPLSYAAFGYLIEPENEFDESVDNADLKEGFRILVEDDRVKKGFPIAAGYGLVDFDEWLMQDALDKYPEKQVRLKELQDLLWAQLPADRCKVLLDKKTIKDAKKRVKKLKEEQLRNQQNQRYAIIAGILASVAVIYWFSNRQVDMKDDIKGDTVTP